MRQPEVPPELILQVRELVKLLGGAPEEHVLLLGLVFVLNDAIVHLPCGSQVGGSEGGVTIRQACDTLAHVLRLDADALKNAYWTKGSLFVGDSFKELVEETVEVLRLHGVAVEL